MMDHPDLAHGEDGAIIQTVDFDFNCFDEETLREAAQDQGLNQDGLRYATAMLHSVLMWSQASGSTNKDGIALRTIVLYWIFIPSYQSLTLTELATMYGLKKQSLGRQVKSWKQTFPTMITENMKECE